MYVCSMSLGNGNSVVVSGDGGFISLGVESKCTTFCGDDVVKGNFITSSKYGTSLNRKSKNGASFMINQIL